MKWYAAHIIFYTKFKDGIQDKYPVMENVVLFEAESDAEVLEKAIKRGKSEEGDTQGTYHWEDRPATLLFAGVRKIIECMDPVNVMNQPVDGTEITYSFLEIQDEKSLSDLISGRSVIVTYEE